MNADGFLGQITVPAPCPADWSRMQGDDRVRLCVGCGKHVYNLSAMTFDQVIALLQAQGDELCGRFHRRPDVTMMASEV
jgi:hypothetical protein